MSQHLHDMYLHESTPAHSVLLLDQPTVYLETTLSLLLCLQMIALNLSMLLHDAVHAKEELLYHTLQGRCGSLQATTI